MKRLSLILAATLVFGAGVYVPALATESAKPSKKFTSCKSLWSKYPNGVAENRQSARDVIGEGYKRPTINRSVYLSNYRKLDVDYSGVVCPVLTNAAFADFILDDMQKDICDGMDVIGRPMNERPSFCQR